MTAMATQDIHQYLDAAYQRIEAWKAEHANHTQDELEAVSSTKAYAEFNAAASTLSKGPRMDYLRMDIPQE